MSAIASVNDHLNGGISSNEPITLAVIGCGQRGRGYAEYALKAPDKCKVVAIAEPRPKTRAAMAIRHSVDPPMVFTSWEESHAASAESMKTKATRLADAIVIAVQDRMHCPVTLAFAEQGYDILCEKPMATTVEDCVRMADAVKRAGIIFGMGHVLRYSRYSKAMSDIIHSGSLGRLINVQHFEPIGHWHFAHSYVRGAWRNEKNSCFSLMTKSCHDIDIICSMLAPATPVRVSSFGSLQHFKASEKPTEAGSATRCLDCAYEPQCPYSAKSIYLDCVKNGHTAWPCSVIVDGVPDIENVTNALQNGPYGKCVYESDNDVVDHQVVNIEFSTGATASFTMAAFTTLICERQSRLHFTHGEIVGDMTDFTVTDFRRARVCSSSELLQPQTQVQIQSQPNSVPVIASGPGTTIYKPKREGGGHGDGDLGLIAAFVEAVRTRRQDVLGVDVDDILRSHLTVVAAEKSRREGTVVNVIEFEEDANARYLA